MKLMLVALSLFASTTAMASTYDGYTLPVTGEEALERFSLNTIQTRTEYTTQTVSKTCYRTVQRGYEQQCRLESELYCYNVTPRPPHPHYPPGHRPPPGYKPRNTVCDTRWINRCYSVPRYVQEAYTCHETIRVPNEVFSHNVKTNVTVEVKNQAGEILAPHNTCNVAFSSRGDSFSSQANCAEYIVLSKSEDKYDRVGSTVIVDKTISLTLLDKNKIASPTANGIGEMRMEGQNLVFRAGNLDKNGDIAIKLYVERRKFLKSDVTLINRILTKNEYSFEKTSADSGLVKIDLRKLLGGINKGKKHVIKVDLNVLTNISNAINTSLPQLSASQSITVND